MAVSPCSRHARTTRGQGSFGPPSTPRDSPGISLRARVRVMMGSARCVGAGLVSVLRGSSMGTLGRTIEIRVAVGNSGTAGIDPRGLTRFGTRVVSSMGDCGRSFCCRCGKGPGERWYGAIGMGSHILCTDCYQSVEDTLRCGEEDSVDD